jgi:hypothetical protein
VTGTDDNVVSATKERLEMAVEEPLCNSTVSAVGGKKDQDSVMGTDDNHVSVTKEAVEESPCNSTVSATAGLAHLQEAASMLSQLKALK